MLDASDGNSKDKTMQKPSKYADWSPNPEQMALKPDVSGDDINGLGELDFRRRNIVNVDPETVGDAVHEPFSV